MRWAPDISHVSISSSRKAEKKLDYEPGNFQLQQLNLKDYYEPRLSLGLIFGDREENDVKKTLKYDIMRNYHRRTVLTARGNTEKK